MKTIEGILRKLVGRLPMEFDPTRGDHDAEAENAIDLATADIILLMESVIISDKTAQEQCPEELLDNVDMVYGFCCGYGFCRSAILENINKMKGE
jgi:hypothetical protein